MKKDPKFVAPELWVLGSTGSFSFEFMGGGIAVVCGLNCENLSSVLGDRACVVWLAELFTSEEILKIYQMMYICLI